MSTIRNASDIDWLSFLSALDAALLLCLARAGLYYLTSASTRAGVQGVRVVTGAVGHYARMNGNEIEKETRVSRFP